MQSWQKRLEEQVEGDEEDRGYSFKKLDSKGKQGWRAGARSADKTKGRFC